MQLPLGQPERQPLVMWLVVDTGVDRRIMPVEYAYLEHALNDVAQRRGLPLQWPKPGPEGEYAVDLALLWGGYTEDLPSVEAEGVIIAAARRQGLDSVIERLHLEHVLAHLVQRPGPVRPALGIPEVDQLLVRELPDDLVVTSVHISAQQDVIAISTDGTADITAFFEIVASSRWSTSPAREFRLIRLTSKRPLPE